MLDKDLKAQIKLIINADHRDPFEVLGNHIIDQESGRLVAVRAFLPEASEAWVVDVKTKKLHPMEKIHKAGFFQAIFPEKKDVFSYRIRMKSLKGTVSEFCDPYSFLPVLTDFDIHLIGEGSHYNLYEKLGAHEMDIGG